MCTRVYTYAFQHAQCNNAAAAPAVAAMQNQAPADAALESHRECSVFFNNPSITLLVIVTLVNKAPFSDFRSRSLCCTTRHDLTSVAVDVLCDDGSNKKLMVAFSALL